MIAHTAPADPSQSPGMAKLLYALAEAAEITSVSERFIWGLADAGDLLCVRIGQRVLIRRADLEQWVADGCPHPRWTAQQAAAKAARAASESEPTNKPRGRARASRRRRK